MPPISDTGGVRFGRPVHDVDLKALVNATTVAEHLAVRCVCHHTEGAHKPSGGRPCGFCRCHAFRPQTAPDAAGDDTPALSPEGERALQILRQTEAFSGVPEKGLRLLASLAKRRLYLPLTELMRQGDVSHSLHVLVKGRVLVQRASAGGGMVVLAELTEGEVVGEMGVLDGSPRSATVVTLTDMQTLELSAEVMRQTFEEFPEALMAVVRIATRRIRDTDALVEQMLDIAVNQHDRA